MPLENHEIAWKPQSQFHSIGFVALELRIKLRNVWSRLLFFEELLGHFLDVLELLNDVVGLNRLRKLKKHFHEQPVKAFFAAVPQEHLEVVAENDFLLFRIQNWLEVKIAL